SEVKSQIAQLQKAIDARGGHFSASRQDLDAELSRLQSQKQMLTAQINGLISDAAPLALAPGLCQVTKAQIEQDLEAQTANQKIALLRSEEHTSELQSREKLVCRRLLEKKQRRLSMKG